MRQMQRFSVWLIGAPALAILAGCGDANLPGEVSGRVTVDGQAPATGSSINFVPLGESTAGTGGGMLSADGSYTTRLAPGKYKVEIRVPRPVGGAVRPASGPGSEGPGAGGGFIEESLPAKYNDQSELTLDVQAGSNQKDWEVSAR
jgi:hypothetical protein